jgi:hypothetical protein
MNKNKIKFKYLLGLWKTLPQYPTKDDIIYEISLYLMKDKRPNGDFSEQTFNSIFGKNWKAEKAGEIISEMISTEDITETKKSNSSKRWYTIKNNPYYN